MITVNLEKRTAREDGKPLIQNGRPIPPFEIRKTPVTVQELEKLYAVYKTSVPGRDQPKHAYFKAKPADRMSARELTYGANREVAQANLELTLLQGILNGSIVWNDPNQWFWQSTKDPDFIILRQWVTGESASPLLDNIEQRILSNGYIQNPTLWRQWMPVQIFRTGTPETRQEAYQRRFFTHKPYRYEWNTALNELKHLQLSNGDDKTEQERFFNFDVVDSMAAHYLDHADATENPETAVRSVQALRNAVQTAKRKNRYDILRKGVKQFMKSAPLPETLPKSDAWKNAFQASGAYHTMDVMIKFNDCRLSDQTGHELSEIESLQYLEAVTDEAMSRQNGGKELFSMMLDLAEDTGFATSRAIAHEPAFDRK